MLIGYGYYRNVYKVIYVWKEQINEISGSKQLIKDLFQSCSV